ncbi:MAG: thiamine diphosphokinase [Caldisericia bacterium]
MGKVALLVLGGSVKKTDVEGAGKFDFVCCADSGLDTALKLGLIPDIVIGDMDSVSHEGLEYIKSKDIESIIHPPDKNFTDGELAISHLQKHYLNFSEIKVLGLTGGRPDHAYGNFLLLKNTKNNIPITAFADGFLIQSFGKGIHSFVSKPGATISIFSFKDPAFVKLSNLKFKFEETLYPFSSRCISNISPDGNFTIEADSDILVFIQIRV